MTDILREIIAHKRAEVARLDTSALERAALAAPMPRGFRTAVERSAQEAPRLIAELKLASPSKGPLAPNLNLLQTANIYVESGATAISVLTDSRYFHGELETLRTLRFERSVPLPLLRKDFIIDETQVYESRANGADAILLIVAAFDDVAVLMALHSLALKLGLTPLVEVHNEREVERALAIPDICLIGINNRDLSTFQTHLETSERVRPMIPRGIPVVSESGIHTAQDVHRLAQADIDAVLIGEALVTASDIPAKVRELASLKVQAHD